MKNLQKKVFCCISILFIVLIFIQHQYVFMYQDDYGYASLTYGIIENEVGMSFSLIDIFKYLVWHYFNWGGRILYFFFEIAIFRVGGLKLMQIVQFVIIVLICIISGKIIANLKKTDSNISVMLTLVFFGLFHQLTLMDGVYWYSASILYIWPLLPFFGAIYLFTILDNKENCFNKCMFILLIFFAAFSQEQNAVFVFMWIVCILFFKKINREKPSWYIQGGGISAAIGCVLTLLAPGNFSRANGDRYNEFYSKSVIKRFLDNLDSIIDINIGFYNWIFIFLLSVFLGVAVAIYAKKKWMYIVSCIFSIYFIFEQIVSISEEFKVFLRVVWIVYYFSILFWYYFKQKKYVFLSLLISGIISQGVMIVSPVVPLRSHTMMHGKRTILCLSAKEKI